VNEGAGLRERILVLPSFFHVPDSELDAFLLEDVPYGDLTTAVLGISREAGRIAYRTRHATVLSSTEEAARLLTRTGCQVDLMIDSGSEAPPGTTFLEATGSAAALHAGWKAALNILEYASGIATRTRAMMDAARATNPGIQIVTPRKIFPGTTRRATKAAIAGGASPHRLGLSETLLVFDHHLTFVGGLDALLARMGEWRQAAPEKKIVIEVTTLEEAVRAAVAGVDVIQVDKMEPAQLDELVRVVRAVGHPTRISAAGGVNLANAGAYAATGVDLLVTSWVYWGKPADIGVSIRRELAPSPTGRPWSDPLRQEILT